MSLPWITAPTEQPPRRIGTPASGVLEIPVLGGLTVEEARLIAELTAEDVSAFVLGAQLAEAISTDEEISLLEAFDLVEAVVAGRPLEGASAEIRIRHAEQLQAVASAYAAGGQRQIEASVTAIVRCRLNQPGWTIPPRFPRVLLDGIWALIREEQAAERLPTAPITEDDLGKPQAADGSPSKPTGRRSSGSSPAPTRASSDGKPSVES